MRRFAVLAVLALAIGANATVRGRVQPSPARAARLIRGAIL